MKLTRSALQKRLAELIKQEFGIQERPENILLQEPPAEARADLASPIAFRLAKQLKRPPAQIAQALCRRWQSQADEASAIVEEITFAGAGFLNFTLKAGWVEKRLGELLADPKLGVPEPEERLTIVVDYSSPNAARPMHVGHIRSTIIGDSLVRILRFLGHKVITDNHLGDWGTQFGMLIVGFRRWLDQAALEEDPVGELARVYAQANQRAEKDPEIAEEARREVVKLQAGDPQNLKLWKQFMDWSKQDLNRLYQRLDVHFDHWLGESFYNPMLAAVVKELVDKKVARESEGAVCIFYDDPKLPPCLVRKSDGAYLYATTDLATIKYRVETWSPDLIIYVTDARQQLHFRQLFAAAHMWGYKVRLAHVWFGAILNEDGAPLRTREGGIVTLGDLLDEAERRAYELVSTSRPDLGEEGRRKIAQVAAMGAVKYGDLSQHRRTDYRFNWDKMLALEGNTAPYMQYAYARIKSIFRRGNVDIEALRKESALIRLSQPEELALGKVLLFFSDCIARTVEGYIPHLLSDYLFELSRRFSGFYNAHRVLDAPGGIRRSRLLLCALVARTLKRGLELLGVRTLEQM